MPQPFNNVPSYYAFSTLAANGSTTTVTLPWLETEVTVYFGTGVTFGSGTITPQVSYDGGTTWTSHPIFSVTSGTANTQSGKFTIHGPLLRFTLTGATSPSIDLRVSVEGVRAPGTFSATFAANGSSSTFQIPDAASMVANATYVSHDQVLPWTAFGTFGGGTIALQVSPDGGTTWFNVDTTTANAYKVIKPITALLGRFTLTGATAPSLTAIALL